VSIYAGIPIVLFVYRYLELQFYDLHFLESNLTENILSDYSELLRALIITSKNTVDYAISLRDACVANNLST
jgi:hypothetical protein